LGRNGTENTRKGLVAESRAGLSYLVDCQKHGITGQSGVAQTYWVTSRNGKNRTFRKEIMLGFHGFLKILERGHGHKE
jgi:hypothetical protein